MNRQEKFANVQRSLVDAKQWMETMSVVKVNGSCH